MDRPAFVCPIEALKAQPGPLFSFPGLTLRTHFVRAVFPSLSKWRCPPTNEFFSRVLHPVQLKFLNRSHRNPRTVTTIAPINPSSGGKFRLEGTSLIASPVSRGSVMSKGFTSRRFGYTKKGRSNSAKAQSVFKVTRWKRFPSPQVSLRTSGTAFPKHKRTLLIHGSICSSIEEAEEHREKGNELFKAGECLIAVDLLVARLDGNSFSLVKVKMAICWCSANE